MTDHRMNLTLSAGRLQLEQSFEDALRKWLQLRVYTLAWRALGKSMHFEVLRKAALDQLDTELAKAGPWKPWNVFNPGDAYEALGRDPKAVLEAGEELLAEIISKGRNMGAAEAAHALLQDPPRKYQFYTERKLRQMASEQVRLIDRTTRRMTGSILRLGRPEDVDALLQKVYSLSRCQTIAVDQVNRGYIRGVAEVLRKNGFRYVYARTMGDDRVCRICAPWEGAPFTITEFLKRYARHPRCRCFCSSTREDGTRDPELHAKSLLVEWEQAITHRAVLR